MRLETSAGGLHGGQAVFSTVGPAEPLALDAPNLWPGATRMTPVDLVGLPRHAVVTFTTAAAPNSLLDQDPVNGLQLAVQRCSERVATRGGRERPLSLPWPAKPGAGSATGADDRRRCVQPRP